MTVKLVEGSKYSNWTVLEEVEIHITASCLELDFKGNAKHLVIDHDHSCCPKLKGCVNCTRGLLCDGCNIGLGAMVENKKVLNSIQPFAEYLTRRPLKELK